MSGPFRLPASVPERFGRAVDRNEPVGFRLDDRSLSGLYGDSLASALLASGAAKLGRSALLGRPRGLMALGIEDDMPFAIEDDVGPWSAMSGGEIVLREGLRAQTRERALDDAWRRFGASRSPDGRRTLPFGQRLLERLRGMLPLPSPTLPPPAPAHEARRESCDVLVIGAGLAGLAAAAALRPTGLDVRVVEASRRAGGIADLYEGTIDGRALDDWAEAQAGWLFERGLLTLGATAIGIAPDGAVTVVERSDRHKPGRIALRLISAGAVVLSTGYRERPLIFPDNDRPGVMLAATARTLLRRHAVAPGARVLVATASDEGHRAALDLHEAGISVDLVIDARSDPRGPAAHMTGARGVPVDRSSVVTGLDYDERKGVLGVRIRNRNGEGAADGARVVAADALVVSGGFVARDELLRGVDLGPDQGLHVAHAGPNAHDAVAGGWAAAVAAASRLGVDVADDSPIVAAIRDHASEMLPPDPALLHSDGAATAFVDLGSEVSVADLARALDRRGGATAAVARRLGLGLGHDDGRLSADLPGVAMAELAGRPAAAATPSPPRATLGLLAARSRLGDG